MNVTLVYRGRYFIREALDLETLAAVLRSAGHAVTFVYHPDTFGVTDNVLQVPLLARMLSRDGRTTSRLVDSRPDAIVFSVLSSTHAWCRRMAATAKERTGAPTIFLGLHPSLVPEHVMRDGNVDFTITGEPEDVILPLLKRIQTKTGVANVGNLWHRSNGAPSFTHRADLVDLDALPLPDKELFRPMVSHRHSYCAMVSRGCPYACTFCEETCSKRLYGPKYFRRKRVETVMRELAAARDRYRYREVIFKDSYLSGDKQWLGDLMQRYRAEIGVPFKCFCTITGFDEETASLLKEGGCYSIEFGLQTWNETLRRETLHRRETNQEALKAFACCAAAGIRYDVDHMFHLPGETVADHAEGAESYRRLQGLGRVKVHFLVYYPTADIVQSAIRAGDLRADAADRLAEGATSDFYNQSAGDADSRKAVAGYAVLYKILPLLPTGLVRRLSRPGRARWLRLIPSPVVVALQAVHAARARDLRFLAYLHLYPAKVLHTIVPCLPSSKRAVSHHR